MMKSLSVVNITVKEFILAIGVLLYQGFDRRVRDYQVPSAWDPGRSSTRATPNPHQKIPGIF